MRKSRDKLNNLPQVTASGKWLSFRSRCYLRLGCCSVAQLCLTLCDPWTAARQASLSFTISQSLLKLMSIGLVMPSNHLILCCPFFLLPSIFPSIRVFSIEPAFHIRWPEYWNFSFSVSPSSEYSGLISPIIVLKWFTGQFNWNKIKISYHLFYIAILTILST